MSENNQTDGSDVLIALIDMVRGVLVSVVGLFRRPVVLAVALVVFLVLVSGSGRVNVPVLTEMVEAVKQLVVPSLGAG